MQKQHNQDPLAAVDAERQMLIDAQHRGFGPKLWAYTKLSGPGWLQSAITLGGGSLAGALFLGILGGSSMLWLQLMAIIMGVVMLSAISYVTLSTRERPFKAINTHINPVLGWGWLIATCMANIIWCMPQFSLCYEALDRNLVPGGLEQYASPVVVGGEDFSLTIPVMKLTGSFALLAIISCVVALNARRGAAAKVFDWFLKGLVGMVVICFVGVVVYLSFKGHLPWGSIFAGFIPDLSQWNQPTGDVGALVAALPESARQFWSQRIVTEQRAVMIGAAATAVGINMTFLMPYSLLHRGWDKPFRGLARFDLSTGMAIPYVLVTSCVVIAASYAFHATADADFLSSDPAVMVKSGTFKGAEKMLAARAALDMPAGEFANLSEAEQLEKIAALPESEKKVASSLVRRDAFTLSKALAPLVGQDVANYVFGLGVFGMGFSTIIILMLINGFAFCEAFGKPERGWLYGIGCAVAGIAGAMWSMVWDGPAKLWLAILASSFGMMLLPIAYITFFMMMNSSTLMGSEKPTGWRRFVWNALMLFSVAGAIVAASAAIYEKVTDKANPVAGNVVMIMGIVFIALVAIGFFLKPRPEKAV